MSKRKITKLNNLKFKPFNKYGKPIKGWSWHKISFDKKTNLITLKGNVIIEKNKSKIIGEKGITNLKTGTTKLLGDKKNKRIKGKFISNKR